MGNPILDMISSLSAVSSTRANDNANKYSEISSIYDSQIAAQEQLGTNIATTKEVELSGKLSAQAATQALAQELGAKMDSPNQIMTLLASEMRTNTLKSMEAKKKYAELDAVSFFDNPLVFLSNQFEKDRIAAEHNSYTDMADSAASKIQDINALVQSGALAQDKIATKITEDSAAAELDNINLLNRQKINEIKLNGISSQINANKALLNDDKFQLDLLMKRQAVLDNEDSRRMMHERLAMEREEHDLRMQAKKDKEDEVEAYNASLIEQYKLIEKGSAAYNNVIKFPRSVVVDANGNKVETIDLKAAENMTKRIASTKEGKAMLELSLNQGLTLDSGINGNSPVYGRNFLEAFNNINMMNMDPSNVPHKEILSTIRQFINPKMNKFLAARKKATQDELNGEATSIINNDYLPVVLANNDADSSIYKAPAINHIVEGTGSKKVKNFWDKVIMPLATIGVNINSFKNMYEHAITAVESGDITEDELVNGIAEYYTNVKNWNNINNNYVGLALPMQQGYNVIIDDADMTWFSGFFPQVANASYFSKLKDSGLKYKKQGSFLHANISIDASKPEEVRKLRLIQKSKTLSGLFRGN